MTRPILIPVLVLWFALGLLTSSCAIVDQRWDAWGYEYPVGWRPVVPEGLRVEIVVVESVEAMERIYARRTGRYLPGVHELTDWPADHRGWCIVRVVAPDGPQDLVFASRVAHGLRHCIEGEWHPGR